MDSRLRGKDNDIFVMCFVMRFVILAKAGIHAGSGKTPLKEMDSRIHGKDNDIFVMHRGHFIKIEAIFLDTCAKNI